MDEVAKASCERRFQGCGYEGEAEIKMGSQRVRFVTVQLKIVCLHSCFKTGGHLERRAGQRGVGDRPLTPGGHLLVAVGEVSSLSE